MCHHLVLITLFLPISDLKYLISGANLWPILGHVKTFLPTYLWTIFGLFRFILSPIFGAALIGNEP
jgi:hypothetical protein